MTSTKNDQLRIRTVEGSLNFYDNQKSIGTAADKAIASRLGNYRYNIINNTTKDEIYLRELRPENHYVDHKNRVTNEWWDRKRKYPRDQREPVRMCMQSVEDHPKLEENRLRREELRMAQIENPNRFGDFQIARRAKRAHTPPKIYTLEPPENKHHFHTTDPTDFKMRRSKSVPSGTINAGTIKNKYPRWEQIANESADFSKVAQANTYRNAIFNCPEGEQVRQAQVHDSRDRVKNYDFSVLRNNNNYSNQCKLTRSDAFYMRPMFAATNNSVKYDIIKNQQRPFCYV